MRVCEHVFVYMHACYTLTFSNTQPISICLYIQSAVCHIQSNLTLCTPKTMMATFVQTKINAKSFFNHKCRFFVVFMNFRIIGQPW